MTPPRKQRGRLARPRAVVEVKLSAIEQRKQVFEGINAFVTARHGWLTSVPGDFEVIVEALPESKIAAELIEIGYELEEIEPGQRILPDGIVEMVLTEGSTVPIRVTHAGIVPVRRWVFSI